MRKGVFRNRQLLVLTTLFVTAVGSSVFGFHSRPVDCPELVIECPAEAPESGKTYPVKIRVEGGDSKQELTFNWSVSSGEIVEGQGTSRLKVRIDDPGKEVTATVEVSGLKVDCKRVASCSFVTRQP